MTDAPVLAYPDWNKLSTLQTDANQTGLGASLTRGDGGEERVLAYAISPCNNTAPSGSTGFSLANLNHGKELSTPGSLSQEVGACGTGTENRFERMYEALELSKANMARSFTNRRFHCNLRWREWDVKIGKLVLKEPHTLSNKAKHYNAA
ncbi:hypothetical protein QAD02_018953 [Eretmocerus hayati]|uniref:Uncharacterized protein n=1 Tax=Eretmocerus hayati TaxID=131215 RepID=A0ACC2PJF3_9HYME|nr:hypothetical protein QAD02_018953 [Eretmocerus hayati]